MMKTYSGAIALVVLMLSCVSAQEYFTKDKNPEIEGFDCPGNDIFKYTYTTDLQECRGRCGGYSARTALVYDKDLLSGGSGSCACKSECKPTNIVQQPNRIIDFSVGTSFTDYQSATRAYQIAPATDCPSGVHFFGPSGDILHFFGTAYEAKTLCDSFDGCGSFVGSESDPAIQQQIWLKYGSCIDKENVIESPSRHVYFKEWNMRFYGFGIYYPSTRGTTEYNRIDNFAGGQSPQKQCILHAEQKSADVAMTNPIEQCCSSNNWLCAIGLASWEPCIRCEWDTSEPSLGQLVPSQSRKRMVFVNK